MIVSRLMWVVGTKPVRPAKAPIAEPSLYPHKAKFKCYLLVCFEIFAAYSFISTSTGFTSR